MRKQIIEQKVRTMRAEEQASELKKHMHEDTEETTNPPQEI